MSDRDPNACGLCSAVRDEKTNDSHEYQGGSSRGCPNCGSSISPRVSVKDGTIYHDRSPVGAYRFKHDPSQGSFVKPHAEGGYVAGHYSRGGSGDDLVTGRGKTPKAAAEDAAHKDAANLGQQFVKRPPAVEKAIKQRLKEDGYESY